MATIHSHSLLSTVKTPFQTLRYSRWRRAIPILRLSAILMLIPAYKPILSPSSILQDIWGSILRAVPKQRKTYSKTRIRQYAGKGLKEITSIVSCPACGRPKRSHLLCPYCVLEMRTYYKDTWSKLREKFNFTSSSTSTSSSSTTDTSSSTENP